MLKTTILIVGLAAAIGTFGFAGTIPDPTMGVQGGSLSDPISIGSTLIPSGGGGGEFGFYNPFPNFITALTFDVLIKPNLDVTLGFGPATLFTCNDASNPTLANPFFLNCGVTYDNGSGLLAISFFGVNPNDDNDSTDNEQGEQEGIPPLLPGCADNPDGAGCTDVGHFIITLDNNFGVGSDNGGWSVANSSALFSTDPTPGVADITTTPETSSAAFLLAGLAGLALFGRKLTRRTSRF